MSSEAFWLTLENKKRLALGEKVLASFDELLPKEPALALTEHPKPATNTIAPEQTDQETDGESITSNEMAGGYSTSTEDITTSQATELDPYLLESGHILLDLITLEGRTASDRLQYQGI